MQITKGALLGTALLNLTWFGLTGCARSTTSGAASTPTSPAASSATASAQAAYTVAAATAPGLGTILVNGSGRALYLLTSVQGGKLPCTDASGCTNIWPDTELPAGVTRPIAGNGIQPALLATTREASGHLYITYGGWSLYTFSGDSGPGIAAGEGIHSFGGTWWVVGTDGKPVTKTSAAPAATSPATVPGY